jgi:hypothetical protein
MPKNKDKWSLTEIPPEGDDDVGEFAYDLFEIANREKLRLKVDTTAMRNFAMYRGGKQEGMFMQKNLYPANLYFANIERTVANITARDPVGEVVDLDGKTDEAEKILSAKLKKWWNDTDQRAKLRLSSKLMEVYGISIEKPFFDTKKRYDADIELIDMFSFFPAPGNWANISEDAPYIAFAYVDFLEKIESKWNVKGVMADEAYQLLGTEREKFKNPASPHDYTSTGRYATPMLPVEAGQNRPLDRKLERGLVIELWIRDGRTKTVETDMEIEDPENEGNFIRVPAEQVVPVYPDGIRKITVTKADGATNMGKNGFIVLNDGHNPNINSRLPVERAKNTHPWGRFPVYIVNSYHDPVSIWGFAAAEQTGFLLYFINEILKKLINWVKNVMTPPLIIQKHCGITRQMIESDNEQAGRLILMPSIPNARIEFMQIPNLPSTFFVVLDKLISLHDRIHAIEDADRGVAPKGVIAMGAIVALQEKNQLALRPKTVSVETLAEQRSKWSIGLWQNWGTASDMVSVSGEPVEFVGTDYAGRRFNFIVESGSTTPRTSLQVQELTMKLAEKNFISKPYLLETLNMPGWQEEVARTSGPLVQQALTILLDSGADPDKVGELADDLAKFMTEDAGDLHRESQEAEQKPKKRSVSNGKT